MTSEASNRRAVEVTRTATGHYLASNGTASIEFGQDDGLLSPVELMLAALGGCAAIDVDVVTSRRSEPEHFSVRVEGDKSVDEHGNHLTDVEVSFDITFPDDDRGQEAASLVARLIEISHDKDCTVSNTFERATPVNMRQI